MLDVYSISTTDNCLAHNHDKIPSEPLNFLSFDTVTAPLLIDTGYPGKNKYIEQKSVKIKYMKAKYFNISSENVLYISLILLILVIFFSGK